MTAKEDGEGVLFAVEDTGPGIAPARRAQVFERYVRLDDKSAGSGLGLAIVRDIALAHRARVELGEGPEGRGTRVAVRFPRTAAREAPRDQSAPAQSAPDV